MVRELMQDMGLSSIRQGAKKQYDKETKRCKNHLNQKFISTRQNEIWVSDVTYFRYKEKGLYAFPIFTSKMFCAKQDVKALKTREKKENHHCVQLYGVRIAVVFSNYSFAKNFIPIGNRRHGTSASDGNRGCLGAHFQNVLYWHPGHETR